MGFKISGVGLDGSGMTLKQLAAKQGAAADNPIMAAKVDNVLVSLDEEIEKCENIEFIDLDSEGGQRIYRQSVLFLMMMALYELEPQAKLEVHFPIHKSLLVEIQNIGEITEGFINELTMEMKMLVAENLPIERHVVSRERAIQAYSELHRTNSTGFLKESDDESVIMYQCDFFSECMIDILADYTGKLGMFKLELCGNGVALSTPMTENGVRKIRSYVDAPKFISLLNEAKSWGRILRCNYVYEMNQLIRRGDIGDLIRVSEALHEKKIAYIADHIAANRHKLRIVSIAGPSSSGKTSFANRLKIHLRVNGLEPVSISLDDYFVNREDTPRNEKGEFDFESIEAIDLKLFNQHLSKLLRGDEVVTPRFNFKTGRREWDGQPAMKVGDDQPIILEGIHCLNERLTESVSRDQKYKIYISALTPLNFDNHNRISTTLVRLIRRILRDTRTRGKDAEETLKLWTNVRAGEERNIFPFQEEGDVMFNSSLIYELSMMKKPIVEELSRIKQTSAQYSKAQYLLELLSHFEEIDEERHVPNTSLLREFIGGSCFFE